MRFHASRPKIDVGIGLSEVDSSTTRMSRDGTIQVMAHYLAGSIGLGRAAELLATSWLDLRTRCLRLDVPLSAVPASPAEAEVDLEMALRWNASEAP